MCETDSVMCDRCEKDVLVKDIQTDITGLCVICMDCAVKEMDVQETREAVIAVLAKEHLMIALDDREEIESMLREGFEGYDNFDSKALVKELHNSGIDGVEHFSHIDKV